MSDDMLIQAVMEAVNECQGDYRVDPDTEVERLKSVVESAFWDQWNWNRSDDDEEVEE